MVTRNDNSPPPSPDKLPRHFQPERRDSSGLQIVALGGLGEIGMNMTCYRYADEIVVVDCGGQFPDFTWFGIDLVIPDMEYLLERREMLKALVVTHGHEDHIGAIPYFVREFKVPIYATRFTVELIKSKLEEHGLLGAVPVHLVEPGDVAAFEHFRFEFLRVSHSTCDAVGLAIETPLGLLVHTGDFRIDTAPGDGYSFDYGGFAELGRRGVLALFSDSTNVEREGFTKSEQEIGRELDNIFHRTKGRILITLFASSIPRIQEIMTLAERDGRRVHFSGRSLCNTTTIARRLGLLRFPDSLLIDEEELSHHSPESILILMTGSQGEPRSVLSRVAMNDHKRIRIQPGDTVIFSSRIIPGHERSVSNIMNHLAMRGAEIYNERTHTVHTSGHGHAGELATMLNLTQPKYFIPIHGEYRHLVLHARLAERSGVSPDHIIVARNGDLIQFDPQGGALVGRENTGQVYIDGKGVGDVGDAEIRERRKVGMTGMVVLALVLAKTDGSLVFGPQFISHGFTFEEGEAPLFDDARKLVIKVLDGMNLETKTDMDEVKEEIRLSLRRFFNRKLERKPVVLPIVIYM